MIISVNKQAINLIKDETLIEKSNEVYPVQFTFDETWDGFAKTVFFRAGDYQEEVELIDDSCDIPSACLDTPGVMLKIRVNGTKNDDEYATSWGNIGRILYAPFIDTPQYMNMINGYYYDGVFYKNPSHTKLIVPVEGKLYYDLTEKKLYEFNGEVYVLVGGSGAFTHDNLPNRNLPDQHSISSITGLAEIIPEEANEDNPLADKGFVIESVGNTDDKPRLITNDGEYFDSVSDLPSGSKSWQSIAYGDGKFVAVAQDGGGGAYSTDGINWTETTMPSEEDWSSIAYGDGKFVAIAYYDSNKAAYSTDGINWTETTLPSEADWSSVAYGDGKFVAVAQDGDDSNTAAYSTDGINWTETTMPSEEDWSSIAYGDGKFVAIAYYDSNKAAYSTDGINWTETTLPSDEDWSSVVYGDGKFVAVAYDGNKAAYSTDGINWTWTTLPINNQLVNGDYAYVDYSDSIGNWRIACYKYDVEQNEWISEWAAADHYFSAAQMAAIKSGVTSETVATVNSLARRPKVDELTCGKVPISDTLPTATEVAMVMPSTSKWTAVTYGDGKFVAVAIDGDTAAYSTDGSSWTETTLPSSANWCSVAYGDGKFVAINDDSNTAAYSTDGINWTETTLPTGVRGISVAYGDGKFVVINGQNASAYSIDCVNWTKKTIPIPGTTSATGWTSIAYGDGKFVAVAKGSTKAIYSTDGISWTQTTMPSSANWGAVAHGNGKFVAIVTGAGTSQNKAAYSTDGSAWTQTTMPSSTSWSSIAYGDGKFVAVASSNNKAAYSTDGISWTGASMPSNASWWSIAHGDGKFVVITKFSKKCAYFITGRPALIQKGTDITSRVSQLVEQNLTRFTLSTTAPAADISDGGIHIVFLTEEPATKYNGYIYLIEEV